MFILYIRPTRPDSTWDKIIVHTFNFFRIMCHHHFQIDLYSFQVKPLLRWCEVSTTRCSEDEFVASNCFDTDCILSMHTQKAETRTYEHHLWNSTMFLFHK